MKSKLVLTYGAVATLASGCSAHTAQTAPEQLLAPYQKQESFVLIEKCYRLRATIDGKVYTPLADWIRRSCLSNDAVPLEINGIR